MKFERTISILSVLSRQILQEISSGHFTVQFDNRSEDCESSMESTLRIVFWWHALRQCICKFLQGVFKKHRLLFGRMPYVLRLLTAAGFENHLTGKNRLKKIEILGLKHNCSIETYPRKITWIQFFNLRLNLFWVPFCQTSHVLRGDWMIVAFV